MRMTRKIIILSILIFLFNAYSEAIYFKHVGVAEGLTQLSITAIHQDVIGRMWFGTGEGVSVYDGSCVRIFRARENSTHKRSVVGNVTNSITEDKEGNIYFDSDQSLIKYNIRGETFERVYVGKVSVVTNIDNNIYVASSDSVLIWNDKSKSMCLVASLNKNNIKIKQIMKSSNGNLWIGTDSGCFIKKGEDEPILDVCDSEINSFYEDSKCNIWVSTRFEGIYVVTKSGNTIRYTHDPKNDNSISYNEVRGICEDDFGNVWIGTFLGLNKYNPITGRFEKYYQSYKIGGLSHSSIFPIYKDRNGTIWLGTYYGGVNYFNPDSDIFSVYTSENNSGRDGLNFFFVGKMVEDKNHNLWICTEGGGLNYFDRKKHSFKYYESSNQGNAISHNNLKAIAYSASREKLYIGTHMKGLSVYDIRSDKFDNSYQKDSVLKKNNGNIIYDLRIYGENLYILTYTAVLKMNLCDGKVSYFMENKDFLIKNICIDNSGYLWYIKDNVVYKVNAANPIDIKMFSIDSPNIDISETPVLNIQCDDAGNVFFGTQGAGLYCFDEKTGEINAYNTFNSQISSNYCYSMCMTKSKDLLILCDNSVSIMNLENKKFKRVDIGRALPGAGLTRSNSVVECDDGEIFVGMGGGIVTFYEQSLYASEKEYTIYFSNLYLNNKIVMPGDDSGVLSEALPFVNDIRLTYDKNNFSIDLSTNNYLEGIRKKSYEYMLDGYDPKWKHFSGNISYTNMEPGDYVLTVKEINDNGMKSNHFVSLKIHISRPWYNTLLARIFYLLIVSGILYAFYKFKKSKLLLETSLQIERKEMDFIKNVNQMKSQFFCNVSHEFRTPLTLIISQIELLMKSKSLSPFVYNKLYKVRKNTDYLKNLITELLEFHKLENGQVKLKVGKYNLVSFVRDDVYSFFSDYANERGIDYRFISKEERIDCYFDFAQMKKVFNNLLSNAFKHSKDNSTIEVMIEDSGDVINVRFVDNGSGIPQEDIDKIFDRFYQSEKNVIQESYVMVGGIGLSLCKSIVERHHGKISVVSSPDYGSIFTVSILKGCAHFVDDELLLGQNSITYKAEMILYDDLDIENEQGKGEDSVNMIDEHKPTILIVEDNEEMLNVLKTIFEDCYNILSARDGKEGLDIASKTIPDIIVSDIMMPRIDGREMCAKIKNTKGLCHIPVVMLTAFDSDESRLNGLKCGADAYLSKPFNSQILQACCENLLNNRSKMITSIAEKGETSLSAVVPASSDKDFLKAFDAIIDNHLGDANFDINIVSKEMNLSRSSLYNKFKELTITTTPNNYIMEYKMKKAAKMLIEKPNLQVIEISDALGFSSSRFSRCFKLVYGCSPIEYRRRYAASRVLNIV